MPADSNEAITQTPALDYLSWPLYTQSETPTSLQNDGARDIITIAPSPQSGVGHRTESGYLTADFPKFPQP